MKRCNFIKTSAIGSSCVLAGTVISENAIAGENYADYTCKITVLRKTLNQEGGNCSVFSEGIN